MILAAVRLGCSASASTAGCGRALIDLALLVDAEHHCSVRRSHPTMSHAFSSNGGSVESLKVRQLSGCRPRARRRGGSSRGRGRGFAPSSARTSARRRPSSFPAFVRSFWQSTLRRSAAAPGRDSSRGTSMRRSTNRRPLLPTVFSQTPSRGEIVLYSRPSAAANTIRDRCASPQPSFGD